MANRPKRCRRCGKPATEARTISRRGNCQVCAVKAFKDAQKVNKNGGVLADPVARAKWLEGTLRAAERAADDAPRADARR